MSLHQLYSTCTNDDQLCDKSLNQNMCSYCINTLQRFVYDVQEARVVTCCLIHYDLHERMRWIREVQGIFWLSACLAQ